MLLFDPARARLPTVTDLVHRRQRDISERRFDADTVGRSVEPVRTPSLSSRIADRTIRSFAPPSSSPDRRARMISAAVRAG